MCGIIGAIAERHVEKLLLNGLKHLEYRGYDSAGLAVITDTGALKRLRVEGKVDVLQKALKQSRLQGRCGIAHTRWATHGKPSEANAHPHVSHDSVAIVHNGIIENHETLKTFLTKKDYVFTSETDSEVLAHLLHYYLQQEPSVLTAIQSMVNDVEGAYGIAILLTDQPDTLYAVRSGSPLVVGVGVNEHFIASDPLALIQVTQQVCYLEEGDIVTLTRETFSITDCQGNPAQRSIQQADMQHHSNELGPYRHYMMKEIHEQVQAIEMTLAGRLSQDKVVIDSFSKRAHKVLQQAKHIQIVACGTSYHAGCVAKYWIEEQAKVSCSVEVASEFRYRQAVVPDDTLLVLISQSGETADLLAALRHTKSANYLASLAIVNVPMSTLAREADFVLMTKAGTEIGVASTKAFTAQLTVLALLTVVLSEKQLSAKARTALVNALKALPAVVADMLTLDDAIKALARDFQHKQHALFLGRGVQYPIALEGALKLKEISYIHAEAYPAGELKHGPLALVDDNMPVIACAPDNTLFEKLKSNLQEVKARGGELIVLTDKPKAFASQPGIKVLGLKAVPDFLAPIAYVIPLQLLAYHVAIIKGTDVDKPRNLAKSVTVE